VTISTQMINTWTASWKQLRYLERVGALLAIATLTASLFYWAGNGFAEIQNTLGYYPSGVEEALEQNRELDLKYPTRPGLSKDLGEVAGVLLFFIGICLILSLIDAAVKLPILAGLLVAPISFLSGKGTTHEYLILSLLNNNAIGGRGVLSLIMITLSGVFAMRAFRKSWRLNFSLLTALGVFASWIGNFMGQEYSYRAGILTAAAGILLIIAPKSLRDSCLTSIEVTGEISKGRLDSLIQKATLSTRIFGIAYSILGLILVLGVAGTMGDEFLQGIKRGAPVSDSSGILVLAVIQILIGIALLMLSLISSNPAMRRRYQFSIIIGIIWILLPYEALDLLARLTDPGLNAFVKLLTSIGMIIVLKTAIRARDAIYMNVSNSKET